ncbi:MAG: 3D-(3,5/4)-trihydroxycyclohexane-1,2-dione acylhydrolase (decyclizing), partial [Lachnospiraceae bacterium]|nr:3D-(3,5/4)-trihydroxycyclohexane-1,2-dione acylhydrolase (decyclizing) [Lachnospiraceae bacterium]
QAKNAWEQELLRLGALVCTGENFEPNIRQRDARTIPEYVKLHGSSLTQTSALAILRDTIGKDDNIVTAGGSLPSCLQRVWQTDKRGGYHVEYGYSCMGYEIGASLGVKMADPANEEYTVVGDGGFQMLNSELGTIMQERVKTNILVFDNCGFGCINNLEMTHGVGSLATEFRYTDGKKPAGDLIAVDYTKIGEAYGMKTYLCKSAEELREALLDSRKQEVACLFDLKVVPKTMTDGYEAWWNVGIAMESVNEEVRAAAKEVEEHREAARKY